MMPGDPKLVDDYYAKTWGAKFAGLPQDKAAYLDQLVAHIEAAQANPYVIDKTKGGWVENPALVALRKDGIPRKDAQLLSLWKNYRAGILPDSVDADRLAKGGVPADQIDRVSKEREEQFKQRMSGSYAMWERDDEDPSATKKGKPMSGEQGQQGQQQQPTQPAAMPQQVTPAQTVESTPPTFQAQINQNGQFVPARLIQEQTGTAQL